MLLIVLRAKYLYEIHQKAKKIIESQIVDYNLYFWRGTAPTPEILKISKQFLKVKLF